MLLIWGVQGTLLAAAAAVPEFEAGIRTSDEEAAELVLMGVVDEGLKIEVGCAVVVSRGVMDGAGATPPKLHEPCRTPTDSEAKKSKSPREKSKPAKGHPGH